MTGQEPGKRSTTEDFWEMVWAAKTHVIVKLNPPVSVQDPGCPL